MANVSGVFGQEILVTPGRGPDLATVSATKSASVTNRVTVINVLSDTVDGDKAASHGDQWFGRLHAAPSTQRWGTVRNPKSTSIEIYNAGDATETVDQIASQDNDGLAIDGPSLPADVLARSSVTFELSVSMQGPRVIDARYTFESSTEALLLVVGERLIARIWRLAPNWTDPVRERWQWRTDLQQAKSGAESRRPVYQNPRRALEWRITTRDIVMLDRMLSGWQSQPWAVPRWLDETKLQADVSAGDTTLSLDTSVGEWRAGEQVVLLRGRDAEAPVVDSVGVDSLTLDTALEQDWPAGTAVYPARLMRLQSSIQLSRPTSGIVDGQIQMIADEDTSTPLTGKDSQTQFENDPVYLKEPNRARAASSTYERDADRIDSEVGIVLVDDPTRDPFHVHEWEYTLVSRTEVDAFVRWLLARQGQANRFRYPTWSTDMTLIRDIDPGDAQIIIDPIDWSRWYSGKRNRDVIAIEASDGRWRFGRVTGASISNGQETLSLSDSIIGTDEDAILVANVRRLGWLELVRINSDRVELVWLTSSVAETALTLRGVES